MSKRVSTRFVFILALFSDVKIRLGTEHEDRNSKHRTNLAAIGTQPPLRYFDFSLKTINETNGFSELKSLIPFIGLTDKIVVLFSMETDYRKIVPYVNVFMRLCIVSHKCFTMAVGAAEEMQNCSVEAQGESHTIFQLKDGQIYTAHLSHNNGVIILFTVSLALQLIHYGKGHEREEHKRDGENIHATVQKQQPKNQGTPLNTFNDMNRSDESSKQQNSRTFVPFTGLTDSKKLNRHCCQNGGTCILGSFCACPKHFTGRYCEHDEQNSNCGSFAHGAWVQKGCRLCRCVYGTLHCLSEIMQDNCDLKMEEEEFLRFSSSGLRLQQTCSLVVLPFCFFALFCSTLHQQL